MPHYDKDGNNMNINHGPQWSTKVQRRILREILSIWKSIMVNHDQPRLISMVTLWQRLYYGLTSHLTAMVNIVQHRIVTKIISVWKSTMVNHGQRFSNVAFFQRLSQYDNKSWSTIIQHRIMTNIMSIWKLTLVNHVYFRVYILGVIIFIP